MKTARRTAWRALVDLEKGKSTRLVVDRRKLVGPDADLALELARGTERWRLLLDFALGRCVSQRLPRDPHLLTALRLGAYQLLKLTRIPGYAAVHETVALVRRERGFANAVLRRLAGQVQERAADPRQPRQEIALGEERALRLDEPGLPDPDSNFAAWLGVVHALPEFLVARWEREHGREGARQIARGSSRTPAVVLRVQQSRGGASELRQALEAEGVETVPLSHPRLVRWSGGVSPFGGTAYRDGWFVAQDPTALRAVEAVGAEPGETILDLCAAPGTKAAAMAEAVAPSGCVHAYDVDSKRRQLILDNVRRLGLTDTLVVHDDLAGVPRPQRVLIDAPCSNTGVLARRVEVRRRIQPEVFASMAEHQRALLEQGLALLEPGGRAVYSTCSLEPEENRGVADAVCRAGHRLVEDCLTLPDEGQDGGYFAVVERAE